MTSLFATYTVVHLQSVFRSLTLCYVLVIICTSPRVLVLVIWIRPLYDVRVCVCCCVNNSCVCMYLSNIQQWLNFCTPLPNKRKIFAAFSCVFVYECADVCKQMAKQKRTKLLMLLAVLLTHTSKMYTYILYTGAHAFSFRYYFFLYKS